MTSLDLPRSTRAARYSFNLTGRVGLALVSFWSFVAVFAPMLIRYPIGKIVADDYFDTVSAQVWMGSDYLGRDVFSRIVMGARFTVGISFVAVVLACAGGVLLGIAAAVAGAKFDMLLSRFLDAMNAIPSKLFGLMLVAAVGSSIPCLILALAFIYTPGAFRFARSLAVNVNAMDFVTVARIRGESVFHLVVSEILPNIIGPVLADFGLRFVFIVLLLSGLSFLGLGVQPPDADWGALVHENLAGLPFGAPAVVFPCLAIASLTIGVNLLIDNLPRKIRDRSA